MESDQSFGELGKAMLYRKEYPAPERILVSRPTDAMCTTLLLFLQESLACRPAHHHTYEIYRLKQPNDTVCFGIYVREEGADAYCKLRQILVYPALNAEGVAQPGSCHVDYIRSTYSIPVLNARRNIRLTSLELATVEIRDFFEYDRVPRPDSLF